jgi:hypothetical protein
MKKKKKTRKKPDKKLPVKFTPLFWNKADTRLSIVRQMRSRCDELIKQTGADSYQKEIIAERATFLIVWLETQERQAIEMHCFDAGAYTQALNTLMGLLRSLGLKKAAKSVPNLRKYIKEGKKTA